MQKFLKVVVLALVSVFLLTLAACVFEPQAIAQTAKAHTLPHRQGIFAEPLLTGTDGSQTGLAKLQGNLTAITAPSGQALMLAREPDCSLTLFTGTVSYPSTFAYSSTGLFRNYERVLHTNAGLSTPVDTFPGGCLSPTTGIGSRRGVYVGQTTSGVQVFAGIGFNPITGGNALLITSGVTSFTLNNMSFSAAGTITTADLNGDGNGDLVVVDNGASTASQVFVLLGNPDGSFSSATPYTVPGTASVSAVIDDINGDHKLDIVASTNNGQISILTGKGDGTFNAAQSFTPAVPTYPGSTVPATADLTNLITADLRGTGKKDIIASNGLVLLNDGAGNFTAAPSAAFPPLVATTSYGPNLASADFNHDGKLDLVVSTGSKILTYLGNGSGSFTPGTSYATVDTDGFVTTGDLDGDGIPDIYIGEANGGFYVGDPNISYALMGNGDGTFQGAPTTLGSYTGSNLSDVNGDGQPDLIVPASGTVNGLPAVFTVQLGTTKGFFNPTSTITLPSTIVVNGFNGPTTLSTAGAIASSFAVGDLNGDGKADLAFVINSLTTAPTSGFPTTFPTPVYFIALSNGDGTFATPVATTFPQIAPASGFDNSLTVGSLSIGDFNHDGRSDLAFTYQEVAGNSAPVPQPYNQGIAILPGVGNGTFQSPILTSTFSSDTPAVFPTLNTIVSTTDINKDGNNDLLVVTHTGTASTGFGTKLSVFLSNGDGTFAPSNVPTAPNPGLTGGIPCALGDLNSDNKLDLVCTGETSASQAQFSVSLGNGDGSFSSPTILNLSGGDTIRSSGVALADFNGDGKVDLALTNPSSISGIFFGKGDGTFSSVVSNTTSFPNDIINLYLNNGPSIAVDLNKDGKPDILTGNVILINTYASAPTIVTPFNTTTTISASASSIAHGASITFTATVSPAAGATGTPTGTVNFVDGETIFGSGTLDSNGKATFATTTLASGSRIISAAFAGSSTFLGSLSSSVTVNVGPAIAGIATTTTLTSSATTAVSGTSITFTATVTPASGTIVPTGTVTFTDGATTLGSGTLDATGKATFTTSTLAVGSHSIVASYGGATTPTAFSNSASSATAVTITSPAVVSTTTALTTSATTAVTGTNITFTATTTPASGTTTPTGTVTFKDGATTLGTGNLDATGKTTFAISTLTVGSHSITAVYGGSTTFSSSTSSAVTVTITAATAADFTLTLNTSTATVARSSSTPATITITPTGGFKAVTTLACTGAPANSTCTISPSSVTPADGTTPVTATLTFQASVATASLHNSRAFEWAATLPLGLIGSTALFGLGLRRRRWPLQLLALVAATILLAATGCGGGSKPPTSTTNTPTPGTYPLTITATSGTTTHTATFTVTIQ